MRFHGDLCGADIVMRDTYVYDAAALVAGEAVKAAAAASAEGAGGVITAGSNALIDIVGVLNETPTSAISVMAAGTEVFAKCIVNPTAYYLAQWGNETTNTLTATDATGETITDVAIDATNVGGWAYINTGSGAGNLIKVGAQTGTTVLTNVTGAGYDDELIGNATGDTYILIRKTYQGAPTGGGIQLNDANTALNGDIAASGDAIVLENYISSKRFAFEPLRTARHGGINDTGATFYGDVYFMDAFLRGASTQA